MVRRFAYAAALAIVLTGLGMAGTAVLAGHPPVVLKGQVEIVPAPNGMATAILVDLGDDLRPPDGVVDQAFRVQHPVAQFIKYSGPATLTYTETALVVETADVQGWTFALAGAALPTLDVVPAIQYVVGIARYRGPSVTRPADEVAATLVASGCGMTAGGDNPPPCETCDTGGPGVPGCAVECSGGTGIACEAHCGSGYHACCSCENGCWCCRDKPERPRPHGH